MPTQTLTKTRSKAHKPYVPMYFHCHACHCSRSVCGHFATDPKSGSMLPEVAIEKYQGYWCIVAGHVHSPTKFQDWVDPMKVSKFLAAKAAGKINVVVNL